MKVTVQDLLLKKLSGEDFTAEEEKYLVFIRNSLKVIDDDAKPEPKKPEPEPSPIVTLEQMDNESTWYHQVLKKYMKDNENLTRIKLKFYKITNAKGKVTSCRILGKDNKNNKIVIDCYTKKYSVNKSDPTVFLSDQVNNTLCRALALAKQK